MVASVGPNGWVAPCEESPSVGGDALAVASGHDTIWWLAAGGLDLGLPVPSLRVEDHRPPSDALPCCRMHMCAAEDHLVATASPKSASPLVQKRLRLPTPRAPKQEASQANPSPNAEIETRSGTDEVQGWRQGGGPQLARGWCRRDPPSVIGSGGLRAIIGQPPPTSKIGGSDWCADGCRYRRSAVGGTGKSSCCAIRPPPRVDPATIPIDPIDARRASRCTGPRLDCRPASLLSDKAVGAARQRQGGARRPSRDAVSVRNSLAYVVR
ncbi:uncharacterized protein PSFLO_07444 [Pseudozyma flocculosa]|uniref:Uncharacterized protein n=1 Tax=Pseudozyma flocculosa TaxID=84751 RepID=A0A5C3FEP8_9BASI|nr:uncharacterized protein PSFLO_07444 [Pseudozyma flocculosa]